MSNLRWYDGDGNLHYETLLQGTRKGLYPSATTIVNCTLDEYRWVKDSTMMNCAYEVAMAGAPTDIEVFLEAVNEAYRTEQDKSRELGQRLHKNIQALIRGGTALADGTHRLAQYMVAQVPARPDAETEVTILRHHDVHPYGTTVDYLAIEREPTMLVEWKSTKNRPPARPSKSYLGQVGLQIMAVESLHGVIVDKPLIVYGQFAGNTVRVMPVDRAEALEVANGMLRFFYDVVAREVKKPESKLERGEDDD